MVMRFLCGLMAFDECNVSTFHVKSSLFVCKCRIFMHVGGDEKPFPDFDKRRAFALAMRHGKVRLKTTLHKSPSQMSLFAYGDALSEKSNT